MAYVVGSVSVEVVPDFRNAQNAITAWFAKQKDGIEVPVKPVFDKNSERDAANVGTKVGKAMADAQAKQGDKVVARAIADAERRAYVEQAIRDRQRAREEAAEARSRAREEAEALRSAQRIAAEEAKIEVQAAADERRFRDAQARAEHAFLVNEARRTGAAIRAALNEGQQGAIRDQKLQVQVEIDKRKAIEEGRETGGLISRSIEHEIHQNAGLIAGAIAGTLALGAPVAIAAASTLFFGIGAVAVAQTERIQSAWIGLWDEIKQGVQADTAVLVPAFDRMAGAIGQSFQRMRPLLREAFSAISPQIDSFVASLTQAAEFALPGLVSAVREGGPVIQGLGDLLEDIGRGTGDFFEILSTHAPAAGGALSSLGDTMAELLPLLAELLGVGAETATIVLPALTAAFSAVHDVVGALGGVLPTLLTSFLAFRVVQGVGRYLSNFAANMSTAALSGGVFSGVQGRLATTASSLSKAMPVLGAAIGAVAIVFAESERNISDWTQGLMQGGDAADAARSQMSSFTQDVDSLRGAFGGILAAGTPLGPLLDLIGNDAEEAERAFDEWLGSLTPLEKAQRDLDIATRNLAQGLDDESTSADELAGLQQEVASASARAAAEQAALEQATRGVTEAMVEQVEQARAQVDSAFAYDKALDDLQTAQDDYNAAVAEFGPNSEEATDAARDLTGAYLDVAAAAGSKAMEALPASMDDAQKSIVGAKAELEFFHGLLASGVDLPPYLDDYVAQLEATVAGADDAKIAQGGLIAALEEVGIAAEAIPGEKAVKVDALTDEAVGLLEGLGFRVREMPDGSFEIRADTEEAFENIGDVAVALKGLDEYRATPAIDADDKQIKEKTKDSLGILKQVAEFRATPILDADDGFVRKKVGVALHDLRVLAAQRPTPNLDADDKNIKAKQFGAMALLATYGRQRPTPSLDADDKQIKAKQFGAMALLANYGRQNPTPTLGAKDNASSIINGIIGRIAAVQSKTVTITTVQRTIIEGIISSGVPKSAFAAKGGAIEDLRPVAKYDVGGALVGRGGPWDDLIPFRGPDPSIRYAGSNGEHMLDGRDVALMGGQAGVYAFREMLNSGKLGGPPVTDTLRRMVATGASTPSAGGSTRDVKIYTMDNPRAIIRAMRDEQQQHDALALPASWGG
jgi:hypothetical protein